MILGWRFDFASYVAKGDVLLVKVIFQAKGLTKRYGTAFALQDISMTISAGDIYGFIGENGAGKTTLMKIIAGLIRQTAGEIALFGKSGKSELNIARRQLGFLIESPAFYPNMTARENLLFYCRVLGIKDKDSRVKDVLKAVSLSDEDSKITSNYSLGMRQRLGIAIALLNEPEFLVLMNQSMDLILQGLWKSERSWRS